MNPSSEIRCRVRINHILYPRTAFTPGDFAILACTVVKVLDGESYDNNITIKGKVFSADIGGTYLLDATLVKDGKYGYGYKIDSFQQDCDMNNPTERLEFLKTFVTNKQYEALTWTFDDPLTHIENGDIAALTKANGIGESTAKHIVKKYQENRKYAKAYSRLSRYGMTTEAITSLLHRYADADKLLAMLDEDPYMLIGEVRGIGWTRADEIAKKMGIADNDPRRLQAYVGHFLNCRADDGHTWSTPDELWDAFSYDLQIDDPQFLRDAMYALHEKDKLWWSEDRSKIALVSLRNLEQQIAHELHRIASGVPKKTKDIMSVIYETEQQQGWSFTEEQIAAAKSVCENNVSIVTGYGGCVDGETEFFCQTGWKKIKDYEPGDMVLQYLPDGQTELVIPEEYHKYPCESMFHLKNLSGSINQVISPEHNVVYLSSKGNLCKIPAHELYKRHNAHTLGFSGKFVTTFNYNGSGIDLTDEEIRLMCAVICDGNFNTVRTKLCRVNLKKQRKKERMRLLLQQSGVDYKVKKYNHSDPEYDVFMFYSPIRTKEFTDMWYNCSQHQLEVIADEILFWDGSVHASGRRTFSTTVKKNADFVQFVFSACGYRSTIQTASRPEKKYLNEYTVVITQAQHSSVSLFARRPENKSEIGIIPASDGFKYCFTVPTHMFVMRYNDRICVTGNTGKSSIVALVLKCLNTSNFAQCALSGRAAARLTEVTGQEGKTIHRLLGYQGYFTRNETNPLNEEIIILDEVSMVGAELFLSLIKAIPTGSKLIMLGDDGQLESIGLCNIFKDMLDCGVIPVNRLTKIHRQAAKSAIITESIKVRNGQQLCEDKWIGQEVRGELQDLTLHVSSESMLTYSYILDHYKELINSGVSKHHIQIVVPMKNRGDACTSKLNNAVQKIVNSENASMAVKVGKDNNAYELRLDDRVICVKNMYKATRPDLVENEYGELVNEECPVYNGDRGVITKMGYGFIIVHFDLWGDIIIYEKDYSAIELGYALSCHKLQGSEAEYVIIGFDMSSRVLLTKEWLYTAITRAKKQCIISAYDKALRFCIETSNIPLKRTFLKELLIETFSQPYHGQDIGEVI